MNYAVSDLHGYYELYEKINQRISANDTVYFLGDAADRGPRGWDTMVAIASDPHWVYLKGNHEQMLENAIRDYYKYDGYPTESYHLLCYNGGKETFESWQANGCKIEWANLLNKLPVYLELKTAMGNLILNHAGFTYEGSIPNDSYDLLWSREHFYSSSEYLKDKTVIHGHTPVPMLIYELGGSKYDVYDWYDKPTAYFYDMENKIDIDCGTAGQIHRTILFNLDTFESEVIA